MEATYEDAAVSDHATGQPYERQEQQQPIGGVVDALYDAICAVRHKLANDARQIRIPRPFVRGALFVLQRVVRPGADLVITVASHDLVQRPVDPLLPRRRYVASEGRRYPLGPVAAVAGETLIVAETRSVDPMMLGHGVGRHGDESRSFIRLGPLRWSAVEPNDADQGPA